MTLVLRELSQKEREVAFSRARTSNLEPYLEVLREMEGGVAYAIAPNGTTARALRVNLNRAARQLDLSLRWAKLPKDAKELIVELAE